MGKKRQVSSYSQQGLEESILKNKQKQTGDCGQTELTPAPFWCIIPELEALFAQLSSETRSHAAGVVSAYQDGFYAGVGSCQAQTLLASPLWSVLSTYFLALHLAPNYTHCLVALRKRLHEAVVNICSGRTVTPRQGQDTQACGRHTGKGKERSVWMPDRSVQGNPGNTLSGCHKTWNWS